MTKVLTILLTLAILTLSTGCAISGAGNPIDKETDQEIEKQRAKIIPFIDENGIEAIRFIFVYGDDDNLVGLLIMDEDGKFINLRTGNSVAK